MKPTRVEIVEFGDQAGILLPPELVARLGVKLGDDLYAREVERGLELIPNDSELAKRLRAAEGVMKDDRGMLGGLAES